MFAKNVGRFIKTQMRAVGITESDTMGRPVDGRIVFGEPRLAQNERMTACLGDVKHNVFAMRSELHVRMNLAINGSKRAPINGARVAGKFLDVSRETSGCDEVAIDK